MRLLLFLLFSLNVWAVGFLQPDEAFKPKIIVINENTIGIEIELGEMIYLYEDKVKVEDTDLNDGIDLPLLR
jgi:thiol:disulfide interchange protein